MDAMDYFNLIYQLPAIVSGTALVAYLWPRRITPHFIPLLTFVVALIVLALPVFPAVALALCLPVGIIHKLIGVSLTGHDPLELPSLAEVREKIQPPKFELRQFVTRGYSPNAIPGKRLVQDSPVPEPPDGVPVEDETPDGVPSEDEVPIVKDARISPAQQTQVKSFVPPL
jgi:hypothetical protein